MSLANFPVCAESAYYATHPNNHIYVIDLVRLSRGKNSKECYIIDYGMDTLHEATTHQYIVRLLTVASSPGPTQKIWERGLVSFANFPICAESAYYVTITYLT